MRGATIRQAANAGTLAPPTTTYTTTRFLHATLPEGRVRDIEPCALGPDGIAAIREMVLPKLARGNVVLPARPRYRLGGSITAPGGCLFELRRRHGAGLVVARIGIGWRDHGASLVWAACARRNMDEPRRPWVVDALDAAGVALLNAREADRISRWVSLLASDLAWAVTPPSAFLSDPVLRPGKEPPWEARETREFGPLTRDLRENDAAGELLMRPGRPGAAREPNRRSESRCAPPLRRDEGGDAMSVFEDRFRKRTIEHVTLPEGASRAAARSQIDTDTLERIREDVLPALATGVAVAVPGNPDYLLRPVAASEGALAVRLESVAGAELMTIGIGWSDPGASEVWRSMAVATEEPRRPWIADALALESLTALGDEGVAVALWSGELARCLAWAVVPDV